jgi:hypothetical protein
MRSLAARALAVSTLFAIPAFAASTEMYTPALPANTNQFFQCFIVNVSGATQDVILEAFMSTGASGAGPYAQTLAPGQVGSFSIAGFYANMYCKFTASGKPAGFRTSVNVLDPADASGPERIAVSLPGY